MADKVTAYRRRLDRSPEKVSPHLTHENKQAISNVRHAVENVRLKFDQLNDKSNFIERDNMNKVSHKLKPQLVDMYKDGEINQELRNRLPLANKSDPVSNPSGSINKCETEEDSDSAEYFGKAKKTGRSRRSLNFENDRRNKPEPYSTERISGVSDTDLLDKHVPISMTAPYHAYSQQFPTFPQQYVSSSQTNIPQQYGHPPSTVLSLPHHYFNQPIHNIPQHQLNANQHHQDPSQQYMSQHNQLPFQSQQFNNPQLQSTQQQQYDNNHKPHSTQQQQYDTNPNLHSTQPQHFLNSQQQQPQSFPNVPQQYTMQPHQYLTNTFASKGLSKSTGNLLSLSESIPHSGLLHAQLGNYRTTSATQPITTSQPMTYSVQQKQPIIMKDHIDLQSLDTQMSSQKPKPIAQSTPAHGTFGQDSGLGPSYCSLPTTSKSDLKARSLNSLDDLGGLTDHNASEGFVISSDSPCSNCTKLQNIVEDMKEELEILKFQVQSSTDCHVLFQEIEKMRNESSNIFLHDRSEDSEKSSSFEEDILNIHVPSPESSYEDYSRFCKAYDEKEAKKQHLIEFELDLLMKQRDNAVMKATQFERDMSMYKLVNEEQPHLIQSEVSIQQLEEDFSNLRLNHSMYKYAFHPKNINHK